MPLEHRYPTYDPPHDLSSLVHALDKRLTETDAWARAGIEANAGNLQRMVDALKETRDMLYNTSNGKPGLVSLVNQWHYETLPGLKARLEGIERRQTWMFRTMIGALVALLTGTILALVRP